jgi:sugar lactone lactonase YvrE
MAAHPESALNCPRRVLPIRHAAAALAAAVLATAGCSRGEQTPQPDRPTNQAIPEEISIPGERVFPESITSTADGTLYIGSMGESQIYRVLPGATAAEVFIPPGTGDIRQVFGVLADEASGTLWACSNLLGEGLPGASAPGPSALHGFELATGISSSSHALPAGAMCNDIAVAPGGDVFVTDSNGMLVLRLATGTTALEGWSPPGAFGPPGGVLDGIAVVGGRVIVNTLLTNKLFAVEIAADGRAGAVQELQLSSPLSAPDGMRANGNDGVLVTDGTGRIQHVTINGGTATVTTVKDGLEGPVSVTAVGSIAYALEGQLNAMFGSGQAEKPFRAVAFTLP